MSGEPNAASDVSKGELSSASNSVITVDTLVAKCLQEATPQWKHMPKPSTDYYSYSYLHSGGSQKVQRVIRIIDLAVKTSNDEPSKVVLAELLKETDADAQTELPYKFKNTYQPLLKGLKDTLKKHNIDLSTPPFGNVIRHLIRLYLGSILGSKPASANVNLRKIGCGKCNECTQLDDFVASGNSSTQFQSVQKIQTHIESRLKTAPDLVSYETLKGRSPHVLKVKKGPAVVEMAKWEAKVKEAREFLEDVGSMEDVKMLMGQQEYGRVEEALKGEKAFDKVITSAKSPVKVARGVKRKQPDEA
ncbi:hypothetical protein CC1G_09669 [Coprinopsis cinerea okayama7|uniref:Uncharacterized protein n=1 Tax=Coprinopsis cinerea (strain Okayama-7 / 130 / ATCC MYA-4618 / FGSC 9003) TaxID=240176 RepID=A8P9G4_COPC7|nr:hypothetical protein CC1G_09669 [Coprinopsis cinerea okayama7\|eukprot:XP_001839766.1 hypothetical protein CC1G_09669 [Coprinopsis cinerea okayama7\